MGNTSFSNSRGFDLLNDVDPADWPAEHYLRNNIAYGNNNDLHNVGSEPIDDEDNSWHLRGLNASDFLSLSRDGVDGPRGPDGSLPVLDFLRLAPGSSAIDRGADVGSPFNGMAPDLGAFESGMPGDFNADGVVDASDFTVWRDNLGAVFSQSDFDVWVANYGLTTEAPGASHTVPEPAALGLVAIAALAPVRGRSRTTGVSRAA
ncbi:Pectate lyase L precursor [Pseudobythopirellula maris]|uniref:Probable pectate lyase C n=1 Tax=Pseudobythopirellula maris TaxID=2527991 RepID=A0A5C5ZWA5_9BACT|nr:hypothetical protein [Pseudobythopirellula maris]TWT90543.1 Pectate lyase L precursor [Pseudobythopirellula maris]